VKLYHVRQRGRWPGSTADGRILW